MRYVKTFESFLNEAALFDLGPKARQLAMKMKGGWRTATTDSPQLGDESDKNRDPEERIVISGSLEGMPWKDYEIEQKRVNKELDKKYQEALKKIGIPAKDLTITSGNFGDIGIISKKKAIELADKLGIKYEVFSVEIDYGKWGKQRKKNELVYIIYKTAE
jgi:hypothetical protein